MKQFLLYLSLLLLSGKVNAQDKSNRGTDFWLGYGNNVLFNDPMSPNGQNLVLYLSTEEATQVTVTVNGTSWSRTVNLAANTVDFSVILPKTGADDCRILNEGIFDRAIHVQSTKPIVAYAHQFDTQLSGATMLLPVNTYGYTYYSINYLQPLVGGTPGKNWFFVIASEDNTTIQITTTDTTEGGILPNQPITVNLNKGQLYNVFGIVSNGVGKDLTGSKIVSVSGTDGNCHPIAVFSGCSRFIICSSDGGEVAQQQIFPASAWGTRYLTYHSFSAVTNPLTTPFLNVFRVMVANPATIVKRNGIVLTGLQNNSFYEFQSTSGDYIESDQPIMVCQYTPNSFQCITLSGTPPPPQGDPELMFLSPIEQNIKQARIYNTRNTNITVCYLTVILPNNGISSLRIDGAPVAASIRTVHPNNSNYTVVAARLTGPGRQHSIISDSAFSATLYGTGLWESYGYIAGTLINNLNSIGSIKNVYSNVAAPSEFTCPGSPFQFTIKVAYRVSSLQWLFSQVTGLSPARDTTVANPVPIDSSSVNGRRYYTYTLPLDFTFNDTGTFFIPVVYTAADIDNCKKTDHQTITVTVKNRPVADYRLSYNKCVYDTAFFSGLADVNNYPVNQYIWTYDDNLSDTIQNASKQFAAGNHPFTLKVITTNGCVDDTTGIVTTSPKPVAHFGYDQNVCLGDSILFRDSSSISQGNIASWKWNFADGNIITRTNGDSFYHRYNVANNYRVALTVTSNNGCTDDTTVIVTIFLKPLSRFSFGGNVCMGDSILFRDNSIVSQGSITRWKWDFSDGNLVTRNNDDSFYHRYTVASNYNVRLMVTSDKGCTDDTTMIVSTFAKPVAHFGYERNVCLGDSIFFRDSSVVAQGNIVNWKWNFADGNLVTRNNNDSFYHRYNSVNNYRVALTVTSDKGCLSDTSFVTVQVNKNPEVSFTFSGRPCIDSNFTFTPVVIANGNNIQSGVWNFGDGNSQNVTSIAPVTHAFSSVRNNINTTLIINGGNGCVSLPAVQIIPEIYPTPDAKFTISGNSFCANNDIRFVYTGTTDATSWQWNFGNGLVTIAPPVTRRYTMAGNYTVGLAVKNSQGCSSALFSLPLIIHPIPVIDVGPFIVKALGETVIIHAADNSSEPVTYQWSPSTALSANNILQPVTRATNDILYKLTAISVTGNCIATDTVSVKVLQQLYIPNAFSPNNDGKNDRWEIPGLTGTCAVIIFNRWGQKIFESRGYQYPWDGTFKGEPQPTGAYYYQVKQDINKDKTFTGSLMIVR